MGTLVRDGSRWVVIEQKNSPLSPLTPFHQRQNNRSPLESPPVAKKLQKIKEGERFFGHTFINLSPSSSSTSSSSSSASSSRSMEGKENRSILKRSGKSDGARNNNNRQTIKSGRRVDFDQDVLVYHFDKVEGSHVLSESQRLNEDPRDRREYVARVLNGKNYKPLPTESSISNHTASPAARRSLFGSREPPIQYAEPVQIVQQTPMTPHYQENNRQIPIERITTLHSSSFPSSPSPSPSPLSSSSSSFSPSLPITFSIPMDQKRASPSSTPPSSSILIRESQGRDANSQDDGTIGEADFSFFEDEFHRLRLKFTIPLGEGVAANDVLVKANTTGNKVRLVGTQTIGTDRYGTIRQEFTERYQLPMEVDPYMIAARLDNNGTLFVEAPVMTADRKRALAIERQTMNDTQIGNMSDFVL